MSSIDDSHVQHPAWSAAGRGAVFLCFWLMIAGYDPGDLVVGAITAAAATWTSLRLLPPGTARLRPVSLLAFGLHFLRQSVVSGIDVAWRAFNPKLPLRPGFVAYTCHLQPGGVQSAFYALSSLLPGTLPTGTGEDGALLVHCLDVEQPVAANLATEEALFSRAFSHD